MTTPFAHWAALAEAATPGPWLVGSCVSGPYLYVEREHYNFTFINMDGDNDEADAAFIAAAREAVPAMWAEIERLTTENAALRAKYDGTIDAMAEMVSGPAEPCERRYCVPGKVGE